MSETSDSGKPERKRTLVLEVELCEFYVDDLPELIAEFGWQPMSDQILHETAINGLCGLLTIEAVGEKDSEIVRTPVNMIGARIEERPPSEPSTWLAEKIDEPINEARIDRACDRAALGVLRRFVAQIKTEYTGQIAELAEQAWQEASLAEDDAEKRESEKWFGAIG